MKYIFLKSNQRIKDYTNVKNNYLTAINFEFIKNNSSYWNFKCDCGNFKILRSNKVFTKNSPTKTCGCIKNKSDNPALNKIINSYKKGAKRRFLDFKLTKEDFEIITSKNCFYCGVNPSKLSKTKHSIYLYNGIDRKNNLIGYTLENCLPCCTMCNKSKRDIDFDIFINWIKTIKNFKTKNY